MTRDYRWTRGEPALSEMLDDDVLQAVMRRDGVSAQQLDSLIERARRRLRQSADARLTPPRAANDDVTRPSL